MVRVPARFGVETTARLNDVLGGLFADGQGECVVVDSALSGVRLFRHARVLHEGAGCCGHVRTGSVYGEYYACPRIAPARRRFAGVVVVQVFELEKGGEQCVSGWMWRIARRRRFRRNRHGGPRRKNNSFSGGTSGGLRRGGVIGRILMVGLAVGEGWCDACAGVVALVYCLG